MCLVIWWVLERLLLRFPPLFKKLARQLTYLKHSCLFVCFNTRGKHRHLWKHKGKSLKPKWICPNCKYWECDSSFWMWYFYFMFKKNNLNTSSDQQGRVISKEAGFRGSQCWRGTWGGNKKTWRRWLHQLSYHRPGFPVPLSTALLVIFLCIPHEREPGVLKHQFPFISSGKKNKTLVIKGVVKVTEPFSDRKGVRSPWDQKL